MSTTPDAPTQNLASLVVLLQKLYEQLTADRQHWANTGKNMAALMVTLKTHLQTFEILTPEFKAQVATAIKDESQQAAHTVATSLQKSITQIIMQDLTPLLQPLGHVVDSAQYQLEQQRQTLQYYFWWFILGIIVSSVFGGLIVRYGLQPQFSHDERQLMVQGAVLTIARQAPTQEERDKILEPYLGKRQTPIQNEPSPKVKTKTVPKN